MGKDVIGGTEHSGGKSTFNDVLSVEPSLCLGSATGKRKCMSRVMAQTHTQQNTGKHTETV